MKTIITVFIIFISGHVFSQVVINADTSKGVKILVSNQIKSIIKDSTLKAFVTNGYWSWEVSPNPEITERNMQNAKAKFKAEHPEIFSQIACDQNGVIQISYQEFSNSTSEKQAFFLDHPELYTILPKN